MTKKNKKYYEILDAAYKLLSSGNFQKMTTAKIAESAGIAEGTLYRYFKNKRHLLFDVLDYYGQAIADRIFTNVSPDQNLTANLQHFVDGFYLSLNKDLPFFRIMHKVLSEIDDPEIFPLLRDTFIRHSERIRNVFTWAEMRDEIRLTEEEIDNIVHGLWGIADGYMIRVVLQIHTPVLKRELEYMVSLFTHELIREGDAE